MERSQSKTRTIAIWAAAVAAGALIVAAVIGYFTGAGRIGSVHAESTFTVNEHRSFPVAGIERVTIASVSERIRLTESKDNSFGVHFTGQVAANDESAVPYLQASTSGGGLDVEVKHRLGVVFGYHGGTLLLEISVPKSFDGAVSVQSVSGSISAGPHTYREVSARSTSGAVKLDSLTARSLSMRSVSGSLTGDNLKVADVSAESTSGAIDLRSSAEVMDLRTVSGAIRAASSVPPNRIEVASTSGSVSLRLPADSQFRLDARSTSGSIRSELPVSVTSSGGAGRHELTGGVGSSPTGSVRIRTVSGSISLSKDR